MKVLSLNRKSYFFKRKSYLFTRKYYDIKRKYYDTKQASFIVSTECNKVPKGVP